MQMLSVGLSVSTESRVDMLWLYSGDIQNIQPLWDHTSWTVTGWLLSRLKRPSSCRLQAAQLDCWVEDLGTIQCSCFVDPCHDSVTAL